MSNIKDLIIIDGHSDYPIQLLRARRTGNKKVIETDHLPGLKKGGVCFETVTVGGDFLLGPYEMRDPFNTLRAIDAVHQEVTESPDILQLVLKKSDLDEVGRPGTHSLMMALEGAAPITEDFSLLRNYYRLGVRALSLTHNLRNIFAEGCGEASSRTGLSLLGKDLIREINRYDLILDLVHINERGFFEALELCENPVLVSHSNARKLCNVFRNLTDEQLKAVAERGGVVGINCAGFMIDEVFENQTVQRLLDHVDYMIDLIGIDHVGYGPDYGDYIMDYIDEWLNRSSMAGVRVQYAIGAQEISATQVFVAGLMERGYTETDIRKIMGRNFLRVYREGLPD
ncbi:MAG: hypothetical protein D3926_21155 [Desulfobacteraceae bacterium]|nr:MAG: hypothetical protein D3926_21155 [Desulfobacteraceae bacterium]